MRGTTTQVDVDALTWTEVGASVNSRRMKILNTTDAVLALRTVAGDASTELIVEPLGEHILEVTQFSRCLQPGVDFYYGQLASGTGTVTILEEA